MAPSVNPIKQKPGLNSLMDKYVLISWATAKFYQQFRMIGRKSQCLRDMMYLGLGNSLELALPSTAFTYEYLSCLLELLI